MSLFVLASGYSGIYRSIDEGVSWQPVYTDYPVINVTCKDSLCYGLAYISGSPNTTRIIESTDRGETWNLIGPSWDLSGTWYGNAYVEYYDVWLHLFENGTLLLFTYSDGIYRSTTGPAGPWTLVNTSYKRGPWSVKDFDTGSVLVLRGYSDPGPKRFYDIIENYGAGPVTSVDKPETQIFSPSYYIAGMLSTYDVIYVTSNHIIRVGGGYFGPPTDNVSLVAHSFDGGATWPSTPTLGQTGWPYDVFGGYNAVNRVIRLLNSGRVLVGTSGGISISDDLGEHFASIYLGQNIVDIEEDSSSTTVYAISYNGGVEKSTDDGSSWSSVFTQTGLTHLDLIEGIIPPVADFTATPLEGYNPLTVQFTDESISDSDPITLWEWDFGDSGVSNVQNPLHIYGSPGKYTVSLTVTNSIGSDTLIRTEYIVVNFEGIKQKINYVRVFPNLKTYDESILDNNLLLKVMVAKGSAQYLFNTGVGIRATIPAYFNDPDPGGFQRPQGPVLVFD